MAAVSHTPRVRAKGNTSSVLCPLTGLPHRLFWMRSAWWCRDCRQKIESCCEGDCASVTAVERSRSEARARPAKI